MIKSHSFTSQEKSSGTLELTINADAGQTKYDELVAKYAGSVEIKGFRKGKVPKSVLESKFKEALIAETTDHLIQDSLKEAVEKLGDEEKPLGYESPKLEGEPILELGKEFTFKVSYDVQPKVTLKSYVGLDLVAADSKIEKEDLEAELEKVREQFATVESKEGVVGDGDVVTTNFHEVDDKGVIVEGTQREDMTFTVGSEQNIYKIDTDIIGMKAGDEKTVSKIYPEDETNETLKGKTLQLYVKVSEVKARILPVLDDELAQDANEKYKTLDDLKEDLQKRLETQLEQTQYSYKVEQVLKELNEQAEIEIPESMVRSEIGMYMSQTLQQYGINPEDFFKSMQNSPEGMGPFIEEQRPEAEKRIKTSLVLEEIAKKENIEVSDEDVDHYLLDTLKLDNETLEEIKKQNASRIKNEVRERKIFDVVFSQAKTKTKKMKFQDLLKESQK